MPEKVKESEGDQQALELHVNPGMATVFADKLQVLGRADGLVVLRWIQDLPEFSSEVSRVIVTQEHLRRIIDLLCKNTGHYPAPDQADARE